MDDVRGAWKVSIRRACAVILMEPSTYHYRGKRRSQAALIGRIKEIAATRVRYGYRRIHVLVRREGWHVNAKRIYRLYRDLGLQLRHKVPKRWVKAKLRDDRGHRSGPTRPGRWTSCMTSWRRGGRFAC